MLIYAINVILNNTRLFYDGLCAWIIKANDMGLLPYRHRTALLKYLQNSKANPNKHISMYFWSRGIIATRVAWLYQSKIDLSIKLYNLLKHI